MKTLTTRQKLWVTIAVFFGAVVWLILLNSIVAKPNLRDAVAVDYSGNEWLFSIQDWNNRPSSEKYGQAIVHSPWKDERIELTTYAQPEGMASAHGAGHSLLVRESINDQQWEDSINNGNSFDVTVYANVDGSMVELPLPEGYTGQPFFDLSPNYEFMTLYSRDQNAMWVLNLETGEWSDKLVTYLPEDIQAAYADAKADFNKKGSQFARHYWSEEHPAALQVRILIDEDGIMAYPSPVEPADQEFYFLPEDNQLVLAAEFEERAVSKWEQPEIQSSYTCGDPETGSTFYEAAFSGFPTCYVEFVDQYDIQIKRRLFGKQRISIVDVVTEEEYDVASWYAFLYPQEVEANFIAEDGTLIFRIDDKLYVADPVDGELELLEDMYDGDQRQYPIPTVYMPFPAPFLQQ